nr:MAG TPA: hypothetical protein [Inoviridae sp.]
MLSNPFFISIWSISVSFMLVFVSITAFTVSSCTFFHVCSSMCFVGMFAPFFCDNLHKSYHFLEK